MAVVFFKNSTVICSSAKFQPKKLVNTKESVVCALYFILLHFICYFSYSFGIFLMETASEFFKNSDQDYDRNSAHKNSLFGLH